MAKVYTNPHHGTRSGGLPRWTRIPDQQEPEPKKKRKLPPAGPEFLRFLVRKYDHRREAAHDPNKFMEYCFTTPEGRPFKQGRMLREWNDALSRYKRVIIVAPRYHTKTTTALGRAMYELGQNIDHMAKILCQSDAKAVKRLEEIREHITTNSYIPAVFPHLHPSRLVKENKHQLQFIRNITSKDPSIEVAGITSSASGDRATILIADDVVDRRNSITLPKVRDQIIGTWDDWINLLPPWGRLWYICTLWSQLDLSHKLMANPAYNVCWYEINLDTFNGYAKLPDGTEYHLDTPLWPPEEGGPWSKERLAERKEELGTRAFARGFSNRPMAEDEQRVDPNWIVYYEVPPARDWPMVLAVDTASTTKDTSDWTGVALAAIHPAIVDTSLPLPASLRGAIKVTKAWHSKINFPDKVKMVKGIARALRRRGIDLDRVVVERAAGGIELADVLEDSTGIALYGVTPRHSKVARLERITPYIERGIVEFAPDMNPILPEVTDETGDLIGELTAYPLASKDIADAFVHLVRFATLAYEGFDGIDRDDADDFGTLDRKARILTF